MRRLILIRHSQTQIDRNIRSLDWVLSEEGRKRCTPLARWLGRYNVPLITSSTGGKSCETAQLVGEELGISYQAIEGLHEQEREDLGFVEDKLTFVYALACLFKNPDVLVMGDETASAALARFSAAVHALLESQPEGDVAIVSHGTVISLFVASCTGLDPFQVWLGMGIPAFITLSIPDFDLIEIVNEPHCAEPVPLTALGGQRG